MTKSGNYTFLVLLILLAALTVPAFYHSYWSGSLDIKGVSAAKTGNILAQLAFYALVVERVTEMYVNSMFSNDKARINRLYAKEERELEGKKALLESINPHMATNEKTSKLQDDVLEAERKLSARRAEVDADGQWVMLQDVIKKHARIFGILTGCVLGLVGIRFLGSISDGQALSAYQQKLLLGTDVVLTGLLLSGGANSLHPLINRLQKIGST